MAQLYTIKEETLTAIGDALREKYGETVLKTIDTYVGIANADGATGFDETGMMPIKYSQLINFYFPGAVKIEIKARNAVSYSDNFGYLYYALGGEYTEDTFPADENHLFPKSTSNYHIYTYENEERVSIYGKGGTTYAPWGYYMEVIGFDENGYSIPAENTVIQQQEREVKSLYSSADIAPAIAPMALIEDIVITGTCDYRFYYSGWDFIFNTYKNKIRTEGITSATYMFYQSELEEIPISLNFNATQKMNLSYIFTQANLKTLPPMGNCVPENISNMFYACKYLREIPEDYFDNWDWSHLQTYAYSRISNLFKECQSLRKIPEKILNNLYGVMTSYSYSPYYGSFDTCLVLDEIKGLGVVESTITTNHFRSTFDDCQRLKSLTFSVNEDGSAKTANWKSQTLDLSINVGYAPSSSVLLVYNSGITEDKQVSDDATYQALKDDADWFSLDINYSRYNHTSAVETINSLPDCSASGGTNTIKFKGAAGALTDGGAINTLTEEEIAVATAKGWTISLV